MVFSEGCYWANTKSQFLNSIYSYTGAQFKNEPLL
uniref:Uncharacterized protein n=1 Tax=Anguilla anguilla TaxID=7936 RepID=A0A0E9Q3E8_ANGAN